MKNYIHLGINYSLDLDFTKPSNININLPQLHSFQDICIFLKKTTQQLQWLAYHTESSKTDHYNRFNIPKKNGDTLKKYNRFIVLVARAGLEPATFGL